MLNETKLALRIKRNIYDAEIARLIEAAVGDLGIVDVDAAVVSFIISATTTSETVTDNSTITDELIITVISIWCNMRIGNPPNYDQLLAAYNSLKGQLRLSKTYTDREGGADDADDDQL